MRSSIAATEAAAQAEQARAAGGRARRRGGARAGAARDGAVEAHRDAVRALDEAAEDGAPDHRPDRAPARRARRGRARRAPGPADGRAGRRARAPPSAPSASGPSAARGCSGCRRRSRADRQTLPLVAPSSRRLSRRQAAITAAAGRLRAGAGRRPRRRGSGWPASCAPAPRRRPRCTPRCSSENEALTTAEVRAQRARDQAAETRGRADRAGRPARAGRRAAPRSRCDDERAPSSTAAWSGVARRREQLGPVNPLAQDEYAEAAGSRRGARDPARRPRERAARAREAHHRHRPPDPHHVRGDLRGHGQGL